MKKIRKINAQEVRSVMAFASACDKYCTCRGCNACTSGDMAISLAQSWASTTATVKNANMSA